MKFKRLFILVLSSLHIFYASAQWTHVDVGVNELMQDIQFLNKDTGFAVGSGIGNIYKTINGGLSWSSTNLPQSWGNIQFINDTLGYVSREYNSQYLVYKTINCGVTWDSLSITTFGGYVEGLCFTTPDTGFVVGDSRIVRTFDGAISWDTIPLIPLFGNTQYNLLCIYFPSKMVGYAGGGIWGFAAESILLKTIDGGITWFKVFEQYPFYSFVSLFFLNDTDGWATGDCFINNPWCIGTRIMHTIDGGVSWATVDTVGGLAYNYPARMNDIFFPNADTGYATGYSQSIMATYDKGNHWQKLNTDNLWNGSSIWFADGLTGYIAGDSGKVLKTTNGGVGFNELFVKREGINVYPNPSKGIINIHKETLLSKCEINIYNSMGLMVLQKQFDYQQKDLQLDLSKYSKGIYLVKVREGDKESSSKVVVE